MSEREPRAVPLLLGLCLLAAGVTAVAALSVAVTREAHRHPALPPPREVPRVIAPPQPIRAEAYVFRTTPRILAIEPAMRRERSAHPRTLTTVRFLRAFPGAPPRIPHGVTNEEFRTDACRTCHARGGYSYRFAAYVPVTPHPERGICTQCHLGVDSVLGASTAGADPNNRCPMCHGLGGGRARPEAAATLAGAAWPPHALPQRDRAPPLIPHDLLFRENCLACHGGPAAVAEWRTPHPERINCRQCHLVSEAAEVVAVEQGKESP